MNDNHITGLILLYIFTFLYEYGPADVISPHIHRWEPFVDLIMTSTEDMIMIYSQVT